VTHFRFNPFRSFLVAALGLFFSGTGFAQVVPGHVVRSPNSAEVWLTQEVRHQLLNVPWYSIFDNIQYRVNGTEVTLLGQTVNPTLKTDAGTAVKNIEGVTKVDNNIEVLPVSPLDDGIRRAEYRSIYGDPSLQRYAMGSVPPIHIIVKGGHVTLVGWVASEMDKDVAGIRAKSVPDVFSVENDLMVESRAE
jgi:hyperosmotically inducible protein